MFIWEFIVTIIIAFLLVTAIWLWFRFVIKEKAKKEVTELAEKKTPLRKKMKFKKTRKRECFLQIDEINKQIAEKEGYIRRSKRDKIILSIAVVILCFYGFTVYVISSSKNTAKTLSNNSTLTGTIAGDRMELASESSQTLTTAALPTNTPALTYPPTPTYTPVPTPTPIPTYIPLPSLGPSFIEEGETLYGDLTTYLGMTAEEVIRKIGKPYKYTYHLQNLERGDTGGIWFDDDVFFAFNNSEETLDMSCEVYMIWVGSDSGIAKNIGSGLDASLSGNELAEKLGAFYSGAYENMSEGGVSAAAKCGEFFYSFSWSGEFASYDPDTPPELIYIYKIQDNQK